MAWHPTVTPKRLGIWGSALFLMLIGLLWIELSGCSAGDCITSDVQFVWAHQPWVVFLTTFTVWTPIAFLMGHFTAASNNTYKEMRGEGRYFDYRDLEDLLGVFESHRKAGEGLLESMRASGMTADAMTPRGGKK